MRIGTWPTFLPERESLFDLLRLPAALSVPGDTLAGAAAASEVPAPLRSVGLASASCCLYWAGMALNDYADRDIDAEERPQRPIPSGRVSPLFALRLAQALTATGVLIAGVSGGRRAVITSTALAGSIWSYDLSLKSGRVGPAAMAACRSLDVLLGAARGNFAAAVPAAALVGAHTLVLTTVSREEVDGGSSAVPQRARTATIAIGAAATAFTMASALRSPGVPAVRAVRASAAVGLVATYLLPVVKAQDAAIAEPVAANMGKAVGVAIQAMIPLQGALLVSKRRALTAMIVTSAWPLARKLSRRRAIT